MRVDRDQGLDPGHLVGRVGDRPTSSRQSASASHALERVPLLHEVGERREGAGGRKGGPGSFNTRGKALGRRLRRLARCTLAGWLGVDDAAEGKARGGRKRKAGGQSMGVLSAEATNGLRTCQASIASHAVPNVSKLSRPECERKPVSRAVEMRNWSRSAVTWLALLAGR